MNPLVTMSGNLSGLLPSLSTIDATGMLHWKPDRQIFQLHKLREIIGWTHSPRCRNCLLYRSNVSLVFSTLHVSKHAGCQSFHRLINNHSLLVQMLNNTQFQFRCETRSCLKSLYIDKLVAIHHPCWKTSLLVINCQSSLGFFACFTNLLVFLTILSSKSLRSNTSMRLVCNMAFSDFLMGIYIIAITIYFNNFSLLEMYHESGRNCWKVGFLWTLGQSCSTITTFLLTLERYFAIVYSLRPDIRIRGRTAVGLIGACWVVATIITGYSLYYNFYKYNFYCIPIRFEAFHVHIFTFTLIVGILGLLFYLMSFFLYIHIYKSAKRAAHNAGVKRESKLAKRIALVVFSNMLFFFLPVLVLGVVNFFLDTITTYNENNFRYFLLYVFPILCLSLNSCCNPILHAYRIQSFKDVLKQRLLGLFESLCRLEKIRNLCTDNKVHSQPKELYGDAITAEVAKVGPNMNKVKLPSGKAQ